MNTTHHITTRADVEALQLSFYTLCKLADALRCVYPQHFIEGAIKRGQCAGVLVLDPLGNFVSFA